MGCVQNECQNTDEMHKEFGILPEILAGMCLAVALVWCYDNEVKKLEFYIKSEVVNVEVYLISLAVALVGGLMMSRLTKLVNLPAVTAYLVAGLLLGPFCIGALKVPGLGFNNADQVEAMKIVTQTALGFIAFTMGNEFRLRQLKETGAKAITIGILQAVIATIFVDVTLIVLHLLFPSLISISCAITLGAIASATAPAATLMVIRQYKADGPLTRLLMLVVAIDDAVGLVLFSVSFGIATALSAGHVSVVAVVVEPIVEVILSLGLGAAMGWLLNWVEQFFHSRSKRMSISVAFVLLTVGLSMIEFDVAGIHCGFSLLLVCMMTGTIFCNICSTSEELMGRIEGWTTPINVLFFVISGAELDLNVLAQPVTLLVGVLFIIARSAGKYYGAAFSCKITGQPKNITDHLGITLLPQAGVALGMAITAASLPDGALARNVVLFSVLVYELVGPALTKRSLLAVGEINPEGRTNARQENKD